MTESKPHLKQYILLPLKGFLNEALGELDPNKDRPLPFFVTPSFTGGRKIRVIDSIVAHGPKLVEMDEKTGKIIDKSEVIQRAPNITYVRPYYGPLANRQPSKASKAISSAGYPFEHNPPNRQQGPTVTIKVKLMKNGMVVSAGRGLLVTAITDYSAYAGDEKVTDVSGEVQMQLSGNTIQRLYCEQLWKWGAYRENIAVSPPNSLDIIIDPLDENFEDCVRKDYGNSRFNPATGVTVGVIDTGVGPHDDLNVIGGGTKYHVVPPQDYRDVIGHGTFVAGLIGARGVLFPKLRGLAPGVLIRAYKIFRGGIATSMDLTHAINAACLQCDILNLSIENGSDDTALETAITNARENGTLVVAAAGNDERKAVNYPAACVDATAVSAMGCKGTFPAGAIDAASIAPPPGGSNQNEFIAAFSNVGTQIAVTAFGVGVLSTLPGNSFGSCSGTSMAAPVVSGAAACLLSQNPNIYNMPRDLARSKAIEQLLIANCVTRGFIPIYEGKGMPFPLFV
jgi:hypothetical protein